MKWLKPLFLETWEVLLDASPYILLGLIVAGLIRAFVSDDFVRHHLGRGRVSSVFKAALVGVPLPLCSCGVLPVARGLRLQGATKGATTAFLISTPESGVDSISVTWALMDPIMTIARPVAAMTTALAAGLVSNLIDPEGDTAPDLNQEQSACCCREVCDQHTTHPQAALPSKLYHGLMYAFTDLWGDIGTWFMAGVFLSAIIGVLIPDDFLGSFFGGGILSMILMLLAGIPIYICATASTPIAAALILKGVSPGAALVFLLAGPATNMGSLSVLLKILGTKGVAVYLAAISVMAVIFGLSVDAIYSGMSLCPQTLLGNAGELLPLSVRVFSVAILALLTVLPFIRKPGHRH